MAWECFLHSHQQMQGYVEMLHAFSSCPLSTLTNARSNMPPTIAPNKNALFQFNLSKSGPSMSLVANSSREAPMKKKGNGNNNGRPSLPCGSDCIGVRGGVRPVFLGPHGSPHRGTRTGLGFTVIFTVFRPSYSYPWLPAPGYPHQAGRTSL